MKRSFLVFFMLLGLSSFVLAQNSNEINENSTFKDRVFVGGGFGLNFGNITFISVSPVVGYRLTNKLSTGVGVNYRYRNDKRFTPDLKTSDYGGNVFGRYNVADPFFIQAELEYLDFEIPTSPTESFRRDFTSFLAGGGVSQPLGGKAAFTLMALYNLSYTSSANSPYSSPIVIRGGLSLGF